jgi:lipopolysaccharide transport system ATP-binding protein
MPKTVVSAEGLGKTYLIGHRTGGRSGETLREALMRRSASFAQSMKDAFTGRPIVIGETFEEISALSDVSFSVDHGEVVGIIGRNGAGKSTLLKILSRITKPSAGRVTVRGRVASLLEVGTGFHSELTGRENIFLNGAILGMTRADIRRRFDEIVAFAEVDRFLDTPVKRYSTGMYVRLAFAVAAHLEPDILVVDEVLAVGDAQFQKKCLGKMEEVASQKGRTVLFVSHQMGMITSLCPRAILLEQGRIEFDGGAADAIAKYYTRNDSAPFALDYTRHEKLVGDQFATLRRAWIEDVNGKKTGEIDIRSDFKIKMQFALNCETPAPPVPNFHFYNSQGQCAFVCGGQFSPNVVAGNYEATCRVPGSLLNNDIYFIDLALSFMQTGIHVSFHERAALSVVVVDPIEETLSTKTRNGYSGPIPGVVRPHFDWTIQHLS